MHKKAMVLILTFTMIFLMATTVAFGGEFTDLQDNWSRPAIEKAVTNGLLNGYNGKIRGGDNLTRAEMATIINRSFNAIEMESLTKFKDVPITKWYFDEMAKAVKMGTFLGSGTRLNPEQNITREEAFLTLSRAFNISVEDDISLNAFSDKNMVSSWAKNEVAALVKEGYVKGSNGQINPEKNITRAELAQIMDNLIKTYIKEPKTYTEDLNGNVMVNIEGVTLKGMTITGDLIIGDGVGDGEITIDGTTVTGRVLVKVGGENSVKIIGNSNIKNIVIPKTKAADNLIVTSSALLTSAFRDIAPGGTIYIDGVIGNEGEGGYTRYDIIDKDNLTIKGINEGKVFGTFVITSNNVVFEDLWIQNKGDMGGSSFNRAALYIYAEKITIKNNKFTSGLGHSAGISNVLQVMSPTENNPLSNYVIEGNSMTGNDNQTEANRVSAISITRNHSSGVVGKTSKTITGSQANYEDILNKNIFSNMQDNIIYSMGSTNPDGTNIGYGYYGDFSLRLYISSVQELHDVAIEGTEIGQYALGSKLILQEAINQAKIFLNKTNPVATALEIDGAVIAIELAENTFIEGKIK